MTAASHTAIMLIDLQNAFCSPKGSFAARGGTIEDLEPALRVCKQLLAMGRAQTLPIVFTNMQFKSDYSDAGLLAKTLAPQIIEMGAYAEGSWDAAIADRFEVLPGDLVIAKNRYDPFCGTALRAELENRRTQHLIVAGLLTNVCVESTVRSAMDRDFEVTVLSDATASYSEVAKTASLQTLARHFARVLTFDELRDVSEP